MGFVPAKSSAIVELVVVRGKIGWGREKGYIVMIRFECGQCGQKIKVPDNFAGKKARCKKCGNIVTIPSAGADDELEVLSGNIDLSSYISEARPATRDIAPGRGDVGDVQVSDADGNAPDASESAEYISDAAIPRPNRLASDLSLEQRTDDKPKRKLPWFIDMFLYPLNAHGISKLLVYWLFPVLIAVVSIFFPPLILLYVVFVAYFYCYLTDCVRDSALGAIRATGGISYFPSLGDAFTQFFQLIALSLAFYLPLLLYIIYVMADSGGKVQADELRYSLMFKLLVGLGMLFFPMAVLRMVMFDSLFEGLNIFMLIKSIIRTHIYYLWLAFLFFLLFWFYDYVSAHMHDSIVMGMLSKAFYIYVLMVLAHLLGRFFYVHQKRLDWPVV